VGNFFFKSGDFTWNDSCVLQGAGKKAEVVEESAVEVTKTMELTDDMRAVIGQALIDFCGDLTVIVGTTEDEEEPSTGPLDRGEASNDERAIEKKLEDNLSKSIYFHFICL
jgi:hypothetical protein